MSKYGDEFSVILHLDEPASRDIERVRGLLPASPFRDDPPHVTLLKDVHSTRPLDDDQLLSIIEPALGRLLKATPHCRVKHSANLPGGPYGITSAILLLYSEALVREHISLLSHFRGHGFKTGHNTAFTSPHASIRLGVPFNPSARQLADQLFPGGRGISFNRWEILRLAPEKPKRTFYELAP